MTWPTSASEMAETICSSISGGRYAKAAAARSLGSTRKTRSLRSPSSSSRNEATSAGFQEERSALSSRSRLLRINC